MWANRRQRRSLRELEQRALAAARDFGPTETEARQTLANWVGVAHEVDGVNSFAGRLTRRWCDREEKEFGPAPSQQTSAHDVRKPVRVKRAVAAVIVCPTPPAQSCRAGASYSTTSSC